MAQSVQVPARELSRLWMDAYLISAAADTAGNIAVFILARALSVSAPEAGSAAVTFFLVMTAVAAGISTAIFGFATGDVLSRKLIDFPIRSWIAVNVLLGLFYGPILASGFLRPGGAQPGPSTPDVIASAATLVIATGVIVNAASGAVQALILRKAASGAGTWIGYSALTGVVWVLIVPLDLYGPRGGTAAELKYFVLGFISFLISGLIMLPAMLRLRSRHRRNLPTMFE